MSTIILLILAAGSGYLLGRQFRKLKTESRPGLIERQSHIKREHLAEVMALFESSERLSNNDVEKQLQVSDATATRYLEELEQQGLITQNGQSGSKVFYTKN